MIRKIIANSKIFRGIIMKDLYMKLVYIKDQMFFSAFSVFCFFYVFCFQFSVFYVKFFTFGKNST